MGDHVLRRLILEIMGRHSNLILVDGEGRILEAAHIRAIYANGGTAARLYRKYQQPQLGIPIIPLPSTSPANAGWSLDRLCAQWMVIR